MQRFLVTSKGFKAIVRSPSATQALIDHAANNYNGDYTISYCHPKDHGGKTHILIFPCEHGANAYISKTDSFRAYASAVVQLPNKKQQDLFK